jgi:hypothetical protein
VKAIRRRIGRRGVFLLFLALLDGLYGYSFLISPSQVTQGLDLWLSPAGWAAAWLATGAVCAGAAFISRDRLAFGLAALLKAAWGVLQGYLWEAEGLQRGWVGAVIWLAFAGTVLVIASWPEALEIEHPPPPPQRDG